MHELKFGLINRVELDLFLFPWMRRTKLSGWFVVGSMGEM